METFNMDKVQGENLWQMCRVGEKLKVRGSNFPFCVNAEMETWPMDSAPDVLKPPFKYDLFQILL